MDLSEKEKEFLVGLEKLTRQTGVVIAGCGCCSSPFLVKDTEITSDKSGYAYGGFSEVLAQDVCWVDPSDEYEWERWSHLIVK